MLIAIVVCKELPSQWRREISPHSIPSMQPLSFLLSVIRWETISNASLTAYNSLFCVEFLLEFFLKIFSACFVPHLWNGSILKNSFLLKKNSVCIPYGYRVALTLTYRYWSSCVVISWENAHRVFLCVSWFIWLLLEPCVWQLCGPNATRAAVKKTVFQTCPYHFLSLNSRYTAHTQ